MANAVITGVIANGVNRFLRPIFWCTHPHPSRNLLTSSPTLSSKYFILFIIIFFFSKPRDWLSFRRKSVPWLQGNEGSLISSEDELLWSFIYLFFMLRKAIGHRLVR